MNDVDKLAIMLHQMLMHIEADYSDRIETLRRLSAQMPIPENLLRYRDALIEEEAFKLISKRVISVLDFFQSR